MNIKRIISAASASMLVALAVPSVAFAETLAPITFEPPTYSLGDINGQDGWSKTGPYDVKVVSNTYGITSFNAQSLRISNAVTSGSFGDQTFSKSLANSAGETSAENGTTAGGTRQNHFEAQFDLATVLSTEQAGLAMSVSPDRGDGARMSYLRFEDKTDGVHVIFSEYKDVAPFGTAVTAAPNDGCGTEDDFVDTEVAILSRTAPHTIKFSMDFVDGPRNDVVKIYVDGALKTTGTSWEDYFRYCEGNETRTVDSLLFRTGGTAVPTNIDKGFLVDNLQLKSGATVAAPSVPTDKDQCKNDGYKTLANTEGKSFKNQGDCVSFVASNGKAKGNPVKEDTSVVSNLRNAVSGLVNKL